MTDARKTIFGKLPAPQLGNPLAEADSLLAGAAPYKPSWDGQSVLDRFVEKNALSPFGTTIAQVGEGQLQAAVETYVAEQGLGAAPLYTCAGVQGLGLAAGCAAAELEADGGVSIMLADYGIAETGSVIITSKQGQPVLPHWLSEHAIVVVRTETVLAYPEDVWARESGAMPRFLSMVTGPSSTADIEAKSVRGAHGPRSLHIILLGG